MATQLERLVVNLEARISSYEKSMNKALGISNARAKAVESRWSKLNLGGGAFTAFIRGAGAALLPVLSLAAAISGAKAALKDFGNISDQAAASGLDAEFFQSIAYQASQGGVSIEEVSTALGVFAKNAGLAAEGKGRMVTALKALDPVLLENIRKAVTQEERVKLVADALSKEADASKKAAIATATFGDSGLKLADVFKGGAAEIETLQVKAKGLGLIVDRDLIARADALGDEFDTTTRIVDLQLKQALINLGPVLVWLTGLAGDLASSIGHTIDGMKSLDQQSSSTLEGRLSGIKTQLAGNDPLTSVNPSVGGIDPKAAAVEQAAIVAELRRRAIEELRRQLSSLPPATDTVPTLDEIDNQNKAAAAIIKHAEAIKDLIANLEFEQKLVGLSAVDQQVMNAARQVGVDIMSEEGLRLREKITLLHEERDAQDKVNDALKLQAQVAQQAGRSLAEALKDGKLEGIELLDILADVVRQLAIAGLANAVDSGNIGASILSGLLSGFAAGTGNTGGARGQVRGIVHGQEAVIPLPSGGRVPVELRMPAMPNGSGIGGRVEPLRITIGLDDDGKLSGIARQEGGRAAVVTVQQAVPGMIDASLARERARSQRRRS